MKLSTSLTASMDGSLVDATDENLIHDAAAAHALMQAMKEWGEEPRTVDDLCVRWIRLRADEIMRQWGFGEARES